MRTLKICYTIGAERDLQVLLIHSVVGSQRDPTLPPRDGLSFGLYEYPVSEKEVAFHEPQKDLLNPLHHSPDASERHVYGHHEAVPCPPSGDVWPAKKLGLSQWVLIPDTHEAVISHEQWDRAKHLKTRAQVAAPSVPTQNPSIERNCPQDSLCESYPRKKR